ncbi:aldo/keto reductase [Skermania piniformis]
MHRTVGGSGLRVSVVGLGTGSWGRETDGDEAAAQLMGFFEAGGTLVDTSPEYAGGAAQRVLAELLDDVIPRSELVLSGSAGIAEDLDGAHRIDCSRRTLLRQLDESLDELGTDHLDVWSIAAWDPATPVDEIGATLDAAVSSGRVRYAGARGLSGWQLATLAGAVRITAGQVEYSLLERRAEYEYAPAAAHHRVGMFATAPLAGGVLTGKYHAGVPADSRGADEHRAAEVRGYLDERTSRVVDAVLTAADGLGTSPLGVALAWARDRPGVAATIVGARDSAQLTGVLAAADLELPRAIGAALDDVSA